MVPSRDKERYAALGATFSAGNFSAVAVVDTVMKNRQTVTGYDKAIDDAMAFSIGANYDMGFMKPFIGFQYGQHEQMIGGVPGVETDETESYVGDLDGYAVAVGSAFLFGAVNCRFLFTTPMETGKLTATTKTRRLNRLKFPR